MLWLCPEYASIINRGVIQRAHLYNIFAMQPYCKDNHSSWTCFNHTLIALPLHLRLWWKHISDLSYTILQWKCYIALYMLLYQFSYIHRKHIQTITLLTIIVAIWPIMAPRSAFLWTKACIISMNRCSTLRSSCLGDSTTNRLGISSFIRSKTKFACFLPLLYASPTRFNKFTMHFLQLSSENLQDRIMHAYKKAMKYRISKAFYYRFLLLN